jgi:pyruvate kinase
MEPVKIENFRRTKIICTMGPAVNTVDKLVKLIEAGMDAARINFSHGTRDEHLDMIKKIREASKITGKPIPIIQDLQGPKIRIGKLKQEPIELITGQNITITTEDIDGDDKIISTSYKFLPTDVKEGDRILLDDGLIELKVTSVEDNKIQCKIVDGGTLRSNKGMNLPGVNISIPSMTEKDIDDLKFGLSEGIDYVALSFVRKEEDVKSLKSIIKTLGYNVPVIAKIEKAEAIDSIEGIIEISDAIMIARGDLGVELPTEDVPILQKMLIQKCNLASKPVITATQMLESMIENPIPTRAEATDVANAVLDGTDAVMLSGETSIGQFPVETVRMMDKIIRKTETQYQFYRLLFSGNQTGIDPENTLDAIGRAVCLLAQQISVKAIVTITHTGTTAKAISKYRPDVRIIAATDRDDVVKKLNLIWGVTGIKIRKIFDTDTTLELIKKHVREVGFVNSGDLIIMTAGIPLLKRGTTNMIKIEKI